MGGKIECVFGVYPDSKCSPDFAYALDCGTRVERVTQGRGTSLSSSCCPSNSMDLIKRISTVGS